MGYYSDFEIRATEQEKFTENCQDALELFEMSFEEHGLEFQEDENGIQYLATEEKRKWYRCEDDLRNFFLRYPSLLFTMKRLGEESGDIEKIFAMNGKLYSVNAEITFPEFDPEKLE